MVLSSLSLAALAWGTVGTQKFKGNTPPVCTHSGKELQGHEPWVCGSSPARPCDTLQDPAGTGGQGG